MLKLAVEDIRKGRRAYSKGPISLEYLESPRGSAFLITDGHHRAIEAIMLGKATVSARVERYIPRDAAKGRVARGMVDVNVFDEIERLGLRSRSRDARRRSRRRRS